MIITNLSQIDHIAEDTFTKAKGLISITLEDYATVKEQSTSLKAIHLEVPALNADITKQLESDIIEAGKENVEKVLLHVKGNGADATVKKLTPAHMSVVVDAVTKHYDAANISWAIGDDPESNAKFSILIILGYNK